MLAAMNERLKANSVAESKHTRLPVRIKTLATVGDSNAPQLLRILLGRLTLKQPFAQIACIRIAKLREFCQRLIQVLN